MINYIINGFKIFLLLGVLMNIFIFPVFALAFIDETYIGLRYNDSSL